MPQGGELFEYYLRLFSSWTPNRKFNTAVNQRPAGTPYINAQVNNQLLESESAKYYGYLMYHMNSVSSKAKRQLFFSTFTSSYYGLSNRGVYALSKYGYGSKNTYFHENMKNQASHSQGNVR